MSKFYLKKQLFLLFGKSSRSCRVIAYFFSRITEYLLIFFVFVFGFVYTLCSHVYTVKQKLIIQVIAEESV